MESRLKVPNSIICHVTRSKIPFGTDVVSLPSVCRTCEAPHCKKYVEECVQQNLEDKQLKFDFGED